MSGNFVHPDPSADNDSVMAPPPTTLSLPVPPTNNYNANTRESRALLLLFGAVANHLLVLYSPSSDGMSQSFNQLPSYGSSLLDGGNASNDWTKIDPNLYNPGLSPSEPSPQLQFEKLDSEDSEVKIKDLSAHHSHHSVTTNMNPRQRQAHRKAIEEKSSLKRKLAEQRLSKAVTSRLGGTFVPGLANQMNQAADIIEYVVITRPYNYLLIFSS